MDFVFALLISTSTAHAGRIAASCPGKANKISLDVGLRFQVNKSLTDQIAPTEKKKAAFFEQTARQQLKYYEASVRNFFEKSDKQIVFYLEAEHLSLEKPTVTAAGAGYTIDPVSHPDVKIDFPYIMRALKKKTIGARDESYSVRYKAKLDAVSCSSKELEPAAWKGLVPADPWLAHWIAPPGERLDVQWRHSRFKIPSYVDSEYADIPDPFYTWYFWNPAESVRGAHFVTADLLELNGEPVSSSPFRIDVAPWKDKETIKATVIFGIVDIKSHVIALKDMFEYSQKQGDFSEWAIAAARMKRALKNEDLDRGSNYALNFLLGIDRFLQLKTLSYTFVDGDSLLLKGKMKESGKNLELRFYFGPTDVLTPEPKPRHWALAARALSEDDIVLYNGHSGLGENFKPENILREAKVKQVKARGPYLLGILSCYSYSYFGGRSPAFDKANGGPVELVETGSSYTSHRGDLGILEQFDAGLSGKASGVTMLQNTDFLILVD